MLADGGEGVGGVAAVVWRDRESCMVEEQRRGRECGVVVTEILRRNF